MAGPSPAKTVGNPRIAKLIELEVSGRIKPEHQLELDTYRAQGLAPKKATGSLTEYQGKSAGFYERALGSNTDFEGTGSATNPRGLIAQTAAGAFPGIANANSSPDRQMSEQAKHDFIAASLRYESGAAIGQSEFDKQDRIFFPQPGDSAEVIAQKAQARRRVIESLKVAAGPGAANVTAPDRKQEAPVAAPAVGGGNDQPPNAVLPSSQDNGPPLAPDATGISAGGVETVTDPALEGVRNRVAAMIKGGSSARDIRTYLATAGVDPTTINGIDEAVAFKRANPGYRGPYSVSIGQRDIPLTGASKALATVGASPVGAGAIAAGDAALAGGLPAAVGALGGNREQAAAAEQALAGRYPGATMAGSIVGGVPAALGIQGGLARAGLSAGAAGLGSDILYGAGYGANKSPDAPLTGALEGAGSAMAGGVLGRSLGRVVSPSGGKLAPLYDAGVRPTPGQRFGGVVNWAEQNAGSIPLVGSMVRGARQKARDQFERGAFNSALGEIDDTLPSDIELGTAPHAYMQGKFNDAYDAARSGMQFVPDSQYAADRAAFDQSVGNGILSGDQADRVKRIIDNAVESRLTAQGGALAGDAYKMAASDIGKAAQKLSATDPLVADALKDYSGIFDAAARRNSDPGAVSALDAADAGYAKAVRIEQAAAARGGDTGRFSPTQFDRSVQKGAGGVRSRSYLRGDALMGDYAEAGKSLVDTVPNSGTPERLMAAGVLTGGAGYINPATLVAPALVGAAYAPVARDIVGAALAPRTSQIPRTLGEYLRRQQALSGAIGAPLLLQATGAGSQ